MGYDRISWHNTLFDALYFPELVSWNGTYISANGKTTQYKDGKTEKERQAEDQAVMAKANALYNGLCKQYGQRYVDAALSQKPIIGMPEKLLKEAFTLKIVEQGTNYAMYRILGWGWKNFGRTLSDTAHLYTVWVQNGRVTDIRYWTNR